MSDAIAKHILGELLPTERTFKPPEGERYTHTSEVIILATPGFWYMHRKGPKAGKVEYIPVDRKYILDLCKSYERLCSGGYTAPVIREHTPDGERLGDVLCIEPWVDPLDKRLKVKAWVGWNAKQAPEKIGSKQWRYTSPGLGPLPTDEQGRSFRNVLLELSLTSAPHQKSIDAARGTHILNGEPEPMATTEERLDALESQLGEIKSLMEGMKTMMEKPKENDPPAPEDKPPAEPPKPEETEVKMNEGGLDPATLARIEALEKQNNELVAERNRAQFAAAFPKGGAIQLSEDQLDHWQKIHDTMPETFKALTKSFSKPDANPNEPPAKPATSKRYEVIPWGQQLGEGNGGGVPTSSNSKDPAIILAECAALHPNDPVKRHEEYKRRLNA